MVSHTLVDRLAEFLPVESRDAVTAGVGVAALMTGQKMTAVALVGKGLFSMEQQWRSRHPDFHGGARERWTEAKRHYTETHQNPTNRALHMAGLPLIVGGTLGLLAAPRFSPPWWVAAGSFAGGWGLNLAGHSMYEKNSPSIQDDPLALLAGPVGDTIEMAQHLWEMRPRRASERTVNVQA